MFVKYLKKIWIVILSVIIVAPLCAGITFGCCQLYSEFITTPTYSATASLFVTSGAVTTPYDETTGKVTGSDVGASLILAQTVVDILNTPDLYKEVANQLGKDYDYLSLKGRTSVSRRSEESLFVDITFSSTDPKEAMRVANKITETACQYIPKKFIESSKADVASTAIKAVKTYPRTTMATGVAGIIGAAAAFGVVFIIESTNRAIKGEEDFTNNFDVPLLGSVPDFENAESGGYRKSRGKGGYGYGN